MLYGGKDTTYSERGKGTGGYRINCGGAAHEKKTNVLGKEEKISIHRGIGNGKKRGGHHGVRKKEG